MVSAKVFFLCENTAEKDAVIAQFSTSPDCLRLVVNHVVPATVGMPIPKGPHRAEALVEVSLASAMKLDALASLTGVAGVFAVETRDYVPLPPKSLRPALVKRMSCLTRHGSLDVREFQTIWSEQHGWKVASASPLLLGYRQHGVLERAAGAPACDGFTELWFDSLDSMEKVLPRADASDLSESAGAFIAALTPFLFREERLI
jgi:hypothetical protein